MQTTLYSRETIERSFRRPFGSTQVRECHQRSERVCNPGGIGVAIAPTITAIFALFADESFE